MPKGYLVVFYPEAPTEEALKAYAAPAKAAVESEDGKFITRASPVRSLLANQEGQ